MENLRHFTKYCAANMGHNMTAVPMQLFFEIRRCITMKSNNNAVVPEAREALNKFKMEAANDLRVPAPS